MFGLTGIWAKVIPFGIAAVAAVGIVWYIYDTGYDAGANKGATELIEEITEDGKRLEENKKTERDRAIDDALRCLRSPTGC